MWHRHIRVECTRDNGLWVWQSTRFCFCLTDINFETVCVVIFLLTLLLASIIMEKQRIIGDMEDMIMKRSRMYPALARQQTYVTTNFKLSFVNKLLCFFSRSTLYLYDILIPMTDLTHLKSTIASKLSTFLQLMQCSISKNANEESIKHFFQPFSPFLCHSVF